MRSSFKIPALQSDPGCDCKGKRINSSHKPSVDYFPVGTHWNSGRGERRHHGQGSMAKKPYFSRPTSTHTMSHNTRMPLVSATALPVFESTRLLLEATKIVEAPEATVHAPPPKSKTIGKVELHVLTILDWKWQLENVVQSLVSHACTSFTLLSVSSPGFHIEKWFAFQMGNGMHVQISKFVWNINVLSFFFL